MTLLKKNINVMNLGIKFFIENLVMYKYIKKKNKNLS